MNTSSDIYKPSELTPLTAVHIVECVEAAGFPAGAVNLLPGLGRDTGAALVAHPCVDAIGFTGSPATGDAIARAAVPKPVLLELGGNNATAVLDDVDVGRAGSGGGSPRKVEEEAIGPVRLVAEFGSVPCPQSGGRALTDRLVVSAVRRRLRARASARRQVVADGATEFALWLRAVRRAASM
ncbi:aldehyde dehydrogenase family protein [Micromonospora sp. NPDC005087]|uniref:aldehyde dehydrogenase family protein n=1 Tax=Micromonospora sp. NPDC005087 TaxID=3364225 RepID=UPI003695B3FA